MKQLIFPLVLVLGFSSLTHVSHAADDEEPVMVEEPLWELGFGAGVMHVPDYPGAGEGRFRGIALPYMIYRGDILRIGGGEAVQVMAAETERFELSMDFDAAFDSNSEDNARRQGMPDLDWLFEVGPQLSFHAASYEFADESRGEVELALRARAVFSTDFKRIDQRGYVFEPKFEYRHYGLWRPELEASISVAPVWASSQLHEYFYDVDTAFVTASRPGYESESGYFGTGINFNATWHASEKLRLIFGVHTTSLHGARNRNSPLFEDNFNVTIGAGFIWSLFESEQRVERVESN